MEVFKRNFVWAVCLILTALMSFGCHKKTAPIDLLDMINERGKIVIGVEADIKPFSFLDEEGQYTGYDIDLAKKIAQTILGDENKIEFVKVTPSNKISTINSGKADMIIAAMTITPQRNLVVDFSDPYFIARQTFLVAENSGINGFSDLNDKTIGVFFGTTAEKNVSQIAPAAFITGFKSYGEAFEALKEGSINALASDDTILTSIMLENPGFKVLKQRYSQEPYGIAFRKGAESLRVKDLVNGLIEQMNNDGTFSRMRREWIPAQ